MSMMPKAIFKDNTLQQEFDMQGCVIIDLLGEGQVEALKSLYGNYFPNPAEKFYSSSFDNNFELKTEISNKIGAIIQTGLEAHFKNYTWFGSVFMSKGKDSGAQIPMHQDWTYVDESKFVSMNVWVALQDTDNTNGTLQVIKGSHKWHNNLRSPTIRFYFDGHQQLLKTKLETINLKAGQSLVFNHGIIHSSNSNQSEHTRLAVNAGIKSKGAPFVYYYYNKEEPGWIEKFEQEDDFLMRFTDFHQAILQRPTVGRSAGKLPFKHITANREEVERILNPPAQNTFLKKISAFFQ